jgi:hypothetical protein
VRRCSAWNGLRAFSKYLVRCILLVTSADESRRQIVVCPPVYAAGLAVSPCGVTSADRRRRQIVVCPPVYAAGLAISPCGAGGMPCASVCRVSYQHQTGKWLPLCRTPPHGQYWSFAVAGLIIMCVSPKTWSIACEPLLVAIELIIRHPYSKEASRPRKGSNCFLWY